MLTHLCGSGGYLDYMDVTQLMGESIKQCEIVENSAAKFLQVDKVEQQLVKAELNAQPHL